jgi:hypothetical protein
MTPVLTNFCLIKIPEPLEKPVIVPLVKAAVQLITDPFTEADNTILVESFEQIVWDVEGIVVSAGIGLTVTVSVIDWPGQDAAVGVMV